MSVKSESKLSRTLKLLEKKYGQGILIRPDKKTIEKVDSIPSGSIELDLALGVGGFPRGRVIELFGSEASGKSSLSLKTIAEAQKMGLKTALIDAEYCFDYNYAELNGVNVQELLLIQPKNAEQAMSILIELTASEEMGLIVVDSVASLCVKAEVEGEIEDAHMGIKARLMGKTLRKVTPIAAETNTCLIFINQTRAAIGVMFGCFPFSTKILTNKGNISIGTLNNKNIKNYKVLSMNENKSLSFKSIKAVVNNGINETWLKLWTPMFSGLIGMSNKLVCTENHELYTPSGKVLAKNLKVNSIIYKPFRQLKVDSIYSKLVGWCLGDSSVTIGNFKLASIVFAHGHKQYEYLKYKRELFGKFAGPININNKTKVNFFRAKVNSTFTELKKLRSDNILEFDFNKFTLESLLYWYLDDGTLVLKDKTYKTKGIQIASFRGKKVNNKILERIKELTNINSGYCSDIRITLNVTTTKFLLNYWSKRYYIPKCMRYKFYKDLSFIPQSKTEIQEESILIPVRVYKIDKINKKQYRYNLEIKDNHNYFANGVLVGNSNITTPGGKALKFHSSVRVQTYRVKTLKKGDKPVGSRIKAKVTKNKVAPPFNSGEFEIYNDEGISQTADIIRIAMRHNIIKKSGSWLSFEGNNLAQGREQTRMLLKEDVKLYAKIKKRVLELLGKK